MSKRHWRVWTRRSSSRKSNSSISTLDSVAVGLVILPLYSSLVDLIGCPRLAMQNIYSEEGCMLMGLYQFYSTS
jgi:hypothetical protein